MSKEDATQMCRAAVLGSRGILTKSQKQRQTQKRRSSSGRRNRNRLSRSSRTRDAPSR